MALHKDFNPGRPTPPDVPAGARSKSVDDVWAWTAFIRLYLEYVLAKRHKHRPPYDWIILGGQFLEDIRHMSEILLFEQRVVIPRLERRAAEMCCLLKEGEAGTFEDGGNQLITSDLTSTHVALSLGRFYVWFEASGRVGPKVAGGCPYQIDVTWTIKDDYDFDLWRRNWLTIAVSWLVQFYRVFGNEYRVIGKWTTRLSGVTTCPADALGTGGGSTGTTTGSTAEVDETDCTRHFPKDGTAKVHSNYMASRDAAVQNAKSLLQDRAQVEAGLVFNGFSCPTSTPCNRKHLENLSISIEDIDVSWSLIASVFNLEWRYQAVITYRWNASFVCRRQ